MSFQIIFFLYYLFTNLSYENLYGLFDVKVEDQSFITIFLLKIIKFNLSFKLSVKRQLHVKEHIKINILGGTNIWQQRWWQNRLLWIYLFTACPWRWVLLNARGTRDSYSAQTSYFSKIFNAKKRTVDTLTLRQHFQRMWSKL